MRTKLFSLLLCGLGLLFALSARAAESTRTPGRILAAKVHGNVIALNKADDSRKELHDSDALSEGYVITTAEKSSVVLIFANGAAVNLGENSSLSIDEFLMDPFDPKYSVADAKDEPSTSVTSLSLARGELVGNVKHLHRDNGSSFLINTPVGAAGIRGTTFSLVLHTDRNGKVTLTLSTSEGLVVLTDLDGTEHLIPAGKQIEIGFDTFSNDPSGRTGIVPGSIRISGIADLPAETQAAIARAVEQILATRRVSFDTFGAPNATQPPVMTTPGDGQGGR